MVQLIEKTNKITLARYCLLLGVIVLPIIAYNDYQHGHTAALVAKLIIILLLIKGLLYSFTSVRERLIRILAYAIFWMAAVGAMTKQDMLHAQVWLPLLPFLFTFLAGLQRGLLLIAGYFLFYIAGYLSHPLWHALPRFSWEVGSQATWAYCTAAAVAMIYELSRRGMHHG